MPYRILADLVLVMHFAFALFSVLGGLLVLKWRHWAWMHVPAVLWAVIIEFTGGVCPLTPLENWFREVGGVQGYQSSFIEHYILPVIYPVALTRYMQIALGILVLGVNVGIYGWVMCRIVRHKG